jgi:tagatose-6-phosphate ketose/aldose isomerase
MIKKILYLLRNETKVLYTLHKMKILNYSIEELRENGGYHTATEIYHQPRLWHKIYAEIFLQKTHIQKFIDGVFRNEKLHIILTGAGTSAFIGLSLQGSFSRSWKKFTSSISTTDLVSHPFDYLYPEVPTLMVSFARSGNSPESVAAVALADQICKKCYHLIITCDKSGELAKYQSKLEKFVFVLPPEANDQSLAMTSSFTGMLLAGILITRLKEIQELENKINLLCSYGEKILNSYTNLISSIAELNFQRAVFLGSGPQFGTATESQLKLQELTDGKIICKTDSFLGFRHGPKAVVDNTTLIMYLFSNQPYVSKYETDLVHAMKKGKNALIEIGIMETRCNSIVLDKEIVLGVANSLDEDLLAVCSVIPAQMLGFFKSIKLGLRPDSPSESGAISRVVQGVNIYPL